MKLPPMEPVKSSKIKAIGHDESVSALYVEFMDGSIWKYWPVFDDDYYELKGSASIGSAQGRLVKDKYSHQVKNKS